MALVIVFLDLDGTLLYKGRPALLAKEAIEALKMNRHLPVIATGRVPYLVREIKDELKMDSYIAANGNYIVYQGKVIHERPIPADVVSRLLKASDELRFDIVMEGVEAYLAYRKETEKVDFFSDIFEIEHPHIDREYHHTHDIYAFVVFDDEVIPTLEKQFPELLFSRSNHFGFDVNLKGDLKAEGIQVLLNHLKADPNDAYAIGDGYNDLTMIKKVAHGIAMGNAYEEVKNVAQYVTEDVFSGGVYLALKHYGLI